MLSNTLGIKQEESYYFLLIPKRLILKTEAPEQTSTFKMSIHKGVQKLQTSKTAIPAVFDSNGKLDISSVQLKFNLPNFNPYKKVEFTYKVFINDGSEETEVGALAIDTVKLVNAFKNEKINSYTQNVSLGEYLDLDYSLFVEKSLYNLENSVKESKGISVGKAGSEVGSQRGSARQDTQRSSASRRNSRPISSNFQQQTPQIISPKVQAKVQARPSRELSQTSSKRRSGIGYTSQKVQTSSKKSDVRERVSKLQSESQQDYSLHAPKGREIKKAPLRTAVLKQSRLKREVDAQKSPEIVAGNSEINWKQLIMKIAFLAISFLLIYNAMTPTQKYYSKKRHN